MDKTDQHTPHQSDDAQSSVKQEPTIDTPNQLIKQITKYGALAVLTLALPISIFALSQRIDVRQRASGRDVPVITPTVTPGTSSPLSTNPPCENLGDVNSDGKVTNDDVEAIRYILRGRSNYTETQKKNGDVNVDGLTNDADIALITAYITTGTKFPECLPPTAPSNLAVSKVGTNVLNISWKDNATNENKVTLDIQNSGDPLTQPIDKQWSGGIVPLSANATSFTANKSTGFNIYSDAQWYKVQVNACNKRGCSAWSNQVVLPPLLKAPTNLKATLTKGPDVWGWSPEGNYKVDLTWTNNATNATRIDGYVQQAGASGNGSKQGDYPASLTSATWNYAISDNRYNGRKDYTGKTFIYWMVACNNEGCSSSSNPVSVTFQ